MQRDRIHRAIFRRKKSQRHKIKKPTTTDHSILDELQSSTTHGIPYLVNPQIHWCEKLFWMASFITCLAVVHQLLSPLFDRYKNSPTVTSVEMDYFNWNISFPAITLCAKYKNDDDEFEAVVKEYENSSRVDITDDLWSITNANLETMDNIILKDSGIIPPEKYAYLAARVMRKFTVHPIVTYNDWPITVHIAMTEVGMCHVVNSNMAVFNNPLTWNHNNLVYSKTNIELGVYDSDFYTHIVRYANLYKIYIHSPDEMIHSTTASITHNRFTMLNLGVTTWSTRVSDELRSFPKSVRKCRILNEPISGRYPVYSYNYCLTECRIKMVEKLCGCVPHFYKPLGHEKICPIKNLSCVARHRKEIASLSVSEQTLNGNPSLKDLPRSYKDCACLNLCEVIKYRKDRETLTTESLVTRLRIEISTFPKVRVTKEIIFGFYDVLLRCGGVLNLCIGCSVISLAEIIISTMKITFSALFRNG